jgi:hypothetical protein
MSANSKQHGGTHYKKMQYEHWDWVHDSGLGYHVGNATKYISRWRKKNGVEDLKKALHYVEKIIELEVPVNPDASQHLWKYTAQLNTRDGFIISLIVMGRYRQARIELEQLIAEQEDA